MIFSIRRPISYAIARELQLKLVQSRIEDQIPDTVLLLEHLPVVTRGRGLQGQAGKRLPLKRELPEGIEYCESERGGDLTYHGPGQLVIYPILKLSKPDVHRYLRALEEAIISELSEWNLGAHARSEATGVWVGDRKVASIGIAVRKWVTFHGVAINAVNSLEPFRMIQPCGFDPEVMASLSELSEMMKAAFGSDWRSFLEKRLISQLDERLQIGQEIQVKEIGEIWKWWEERVLSSRPGLSRPSVERAPFFANVLTNYQIRS